ncbi:hypothetical protein HK096_010589 [Nowakowskiella sp. JEL0078]|nr:hypothetical protein HK096_010589 [Nowakowskiella sp. JEL0078]
MRYANLEESSELIRMRQQKYVDRMNELDIIEDLMNEGMDDAFMEIDHSWSTSYALPKKKNINEPISDLDFEVEDILEEVLLKVNQPKKPSQASNAGYSNHSYPGMSVMNLFPETPSHPVQNSPDQMSPKAPLSKINIETNLPRHSADDRTFLESSAVSCTMNLEKRAPVIMALFVRPLKNTIHKSKGEISINVNVDGVTVYIRDPSINLKHLRSDNHDPTNEVTIDDVKRAISSDLFAIGQLKIMKENYSIVKHFNLGWLDTNKIFHVMSPCDKISDYGLIHGDTVHIEIDE